MCLHRPSLPPLLLLSAAAACSRRIQIQRGARLGGRSVCRPAMARLLQRMEQSRGRRVPIILDAEEEVRLAEVNGEAAVRAQESVPTELLYVSREAKRNTIRLPAL